MALVIGMLAIVITFDVILWLLVTIMNIWIHPSIYLWLIITLNHIMSKIVIHPFDPCVV